MLGLKRTKLGGEISRSRHVRLRNSTHLFYSIRCNHDAKTVPFEFLASSQIYGHCLMYGICIVPCLMTYQIEVRIGLQTTYTLGMKHSILVFIAL